MTRSRSPTRLRCSSPTSVESWKPVGSLDSSIRSAARATYSAYKRQPIRWRLAGGSAALTLVILCGFAVIVGTLTTRAIYDNFNRQVASTADRLANQLSYTYVGSVDPRHLRYKPSGPDLNDVASAYSAAVRVVGANGVRLDSSQNAPSFGRPTVGDQVIGGWRVSTRRVLGVIGG